MSKYFFKKFDDYVLEKRGKETDGVMSVEKPMANPIIEKIIMTMVKPSLQKEGLKYLSYMPEVAYSIEDKFFKMGYRVFFTQKDMPFSLRLNVEESENQKMYSKIGKSIEIKSIDLFTSYKDSIVNAKKEKITDGITPTYTIIYSAEYVLDKVISEIGKILNGDTEDLKYFSVVQPNESNVSESALYLETCEYELLDARQTTVSIDSLQSFETTYNSWSQGKDERQILIKLNELARKTNGKKEFKDIYQKIVQIKQLNKGIAVKLNSKKPNGEVSNKMPVLQGKTEQVEITIPKEVEIELEKYKQMTETQRVEMVFDDLKLAIEIVAKKRAMNALIALGRGGIGKTFNVLQILESTSPTKLQDGQVIPAFNMISDKNAGNNAELLGDSERCFFYIKGKLTIGALSKYLCTYPNHLYVFDDCDEKIIKENANFFKELMNISDGNTRIITNSSLSSEVFNNTRLIKKFSDARWQQFFNFSEVNGTYIAKLKTNDYQFQSITSKLNVKFNFNTEDSKGNSRWVTRDASSIIGQNDDDDLNPVITNNDDDGDGISSDDEDALLSQIGDDEDDELIKKFNDVTISNQTKDELKSTAVCDYFKNKLIDRGITPDAFPVNAQVILLTNMKIEPILELEQGAIASRSLIFNLEISENAVAGLTSKINQKDVENGVFSQEQVDFLNENMFSLIRDDKTEYNLSFIPSLIQLRKNEVQKLLARILPFSSPPTQEEKDRIRRFCYCYTA